MAQAPAPDVDDDFALSESEDADMGGDDALSDLSDPTMDEIDEWARVDAPTVLSGSSHNGSEDKQEDDVPALGTAPASTSDPSSQLMQDTQDDDAEPAKAAPTSTATVEDQSSAALDESQQRGEGSSSKRVSADSQQEIEDSDADDDGGETSPAGAWGWSGSDWGLKAIGGKLKEVAAGAVRDVKELKDSLQQALNEAAVATGRRRSRLPQITHPSAGRVQPWCAYRSRGGCHTDSSTAGRADHWAMSLSSPHNPCT
jgi:hypothetical protein